MQPRVRLSLTGGLVLLTGGLLMTNSVWTLPLVVVGAVMIVIAWIGHRLEGRFAIEWGQGGTELAFRATVKPAQPGHATLTGAASAPHELARAGQPEREQTIDGEAHTVEIDVGELKALIAAVETAQAGGPAADGPVAGGPVADAQRSDIRIRRVAGGGRPSGPSAPVGVTRGKLASSNTP
jgi:hypothetical protein